MARTRKAGGKKWQVWVSVAALGLGLGLLAMALWPAEHHSRPVASLAPPTPAPRHPLADPFAGEQGVTVPVPPVAAPPPPEAPPPPPPEPAQTALAPPPRPAPAPGTAAWRRFAVASGPEDGRPMIAIVIDDMGLDRRHSAAVLELPAPLTLSYMTYAEDLGEQTEQARRHGDEIMLHVPMEPLAPHIDPGPNALRVSQDDAEIRRRLDWGLGRIDGITGINNHMGSRFTQSTEGMGVVMAALRERGLFFLDSRTTPHSVGLAQAEAAGVPHAGRDIFLDDDMAAPAVAGELAKTEAVARRNGVAIAIGHPHEATIAELRRWLPLVAGRGFRLVPMSAVIAHDAGLGGHVARE
jgi:polysaccharide deacetylase 2 family uncharacterized protein YibQ